MYQKPKFRIDISRAFDINSTEFVSVYDELSLWSAPFGLKLLDVVKLRRNINALDIGCGTGFPLVELSQRLGSTSRVYGIDPWGAAHQRVRQKLTQLGITNITMVNGNAERMPFADGFFNLIVSNNGLNNVADPVAALRECNRISRRGAQMVLTMNLPDTMKEFYGVFRVTLAEVGLSGRLDALDAHIHEKRKPISFWVDLIERSGFVVHHAGVNEFTLRYLDGTALLHHWFIELAFLPAWRDLVPATRAHEILAKLEQNLNAFALEHGDLRLTVPFVCFDCTKSSL